MRSVTFLVLSSVAVVAPTVSATVTEYTNKANWQNAVGNHYSSITFMELPEFTHVTNQYSNIGVLFTDQNGDVIISDSGLFADGWGLDGQFDPIDLVFSQPTNWIAVDFPGSLKILLFSQGQLMYASTNFIHGGAGWFAGLVSDRPFDSARILDPLDDVVVIDNLHFGPPIPGPGALGVFAVAALAGRRRRRR